MILSPHSMTEAQLCMKRFEYYKIDGLVSNKPRKNLNRGTLIHKILADYYNGIKEGLAKVDIIKAAIDKGRIDSIDMGMEVDDANDAIKACMDYFNYYANETWAPLEVEKMFSAEIYSDDDLSLIFEGRLDLIVRAENEALIVDHKSEDRKSKRSALDNQFIGYAFVFGLNKVVQNVIGMQKSYEPSKRFERIIHFYTKEMIQEWYESTIYHAKHILQCDENKFFPRSYSSCNKWGGCPYKAICESDTETRPWIIQRDFEKNEFDLQKEEIIAGESE
jgi:hypothetical protein